jgi:hypothetical protein
LISNVSLSRRVQSSSELETETKMPLNTSNGVIDAISDGYSIKTVYHADETTPQEDQTTPLHPRLSRKTIYHPANKDFIREYCDAFGVINEQGLLKMTFIDDETNIKYIAVEALLVKRKRIRDKFFDE